MSLGLCCQWLELDKKDKPKNILVSRNLQLGRFKRGEYSASRIKQTYVDNLQNIIDVLPKIISSGIKVFRISSALFPLQDKVDPDLVENEDIDLLFKQIGAIVLANDIRVTTHPGQYSVLSSDEEHKVVNAITDINHHGWMFDKMGLPKTPHYSINVHGGKSDRGQQLRAGISRLNDSTRSRLTLENCEFAYSVKELEPVSREMGIPICFDSHHHRFNTGGLPGKEAMAIAVDTWPSHSKPLTHLSNSKPEYSEDDPPAKLRKHSDYLQYVPGYQLEANNKGLIDIDIEAKKKNFAILKCLGDLGLNL